MLRITDITETNRELASAMMEAYLAAILNNLNLIMKKLTALAAIFAAHAHRRHIRNELPQHARTGIRIRLLHRAWRDGDGFVPDFPIFPTQ
jgi:hypothetical protein